MNSKDPLNWFHGKLGREEAEKLLNNGNEDGTFLVRESSTAVGDFVLSLLYKNEVCHYQIRRHGEDAFFSIEDKGNILHGLETLVEFYKQNGNGLVTKLTSHIAKDPPPNDTRSHGITNLLHRAVMKNNHVVVSELLKCGYRNVNAKNQDGQTAVHLAAIHGDEDILRLLINAGVNINCMDTDNYMPLHYACRHQSGIFIRSLLSEQANIQGRNIRNGYVPLHEAAKYGNLVAVQELLAAHAPLLPRTTLGEFPIDLAKEGNRSEVVNFLENYKLLPPHTYRSQWYHGTLKREEAVQVLKEFSASMEKQHASENANNMDPTINSNQKVFTSGCFLVRFSERKNTGSGYVLTVLYENTIKNFIISQSSKYLYIDDGPFLPSLEHLVEHFMRFADGLPINLKYPVIPKPKPPLPLFSTMPRVQHKKIFHDVRDEHLKERNKLYSTDNENLGDSQPKQKQTQTLPGGSVKPTKGVTSSVFHTLRLRSPKKTNLSTWRKPDNKSKNKDQDTAITRERELKQTEHLLKDLTFSTDFNQTNLLRGISTNETQLTDNFYNVPKNNSTNNLDIQTSFNSKGNAALNHKTDENFMECKTEAEVDYFTKSDVLIEQERTVFKDLKNTADSYVPTVDIRIFKESNMDGNKNMANDFISTETSQRPKYSVQREATSISESVDVNINSVTATESNYFIACNLLELDYIIGEGEFGSVYKGHMIRENENDEQTRVEVAIKTLRDEHCHSNKQEFLREASVMMQLEHHCIVQLIGISKGLTWMMVQELVPLGSMLQFILSNKEKINPNYELKLWASQIACGMQYLESNHFVHRDLAARNILLASRNQAKISDFGLSRALGTANESYQATQGGKWPIKWYAPESFNNGVFSHASDVWSYGVTLWEMFSLGEVPYGDIRGIDAIQLIEKGQRLLQPLKCPKHIYEIMQNCWNYKAKDRPTFRFLTEFFSRDPGYQNIVELVKTKHIS